MNDNELDKLFSEQLKNRASKPSASVWNNIEAELDRKEKSGTIYRLTWLKYAAAALAVLGTSTWWYTQQPADQQITQQTTTPQQVDQQPNPSQQGVNFEESKALIAKTKIKNHTAASRLANKTTAKSSGQVEKVERTVLSHGDEDRAVAIENNILASIPVNKPSLTLSSQEINEGQVLKRRVVEIAPIRPLVDLGEEEETETMLAMAPSSSESVVTGILNKISDVIVSDDQKKPRFSKDEEGSFRIDFTNNFAKNKFKRRK